MTLRIGVDIGGTFTDLAFIDDASGIVHTHKLLTTPDDPSRAVVQGVREIAELAGHKVSDVGAIVHGTTLVTNAVIERRGCRVGMLVTKGFKDTLDLAHETRYDLYDLRLQFAPPLIERSARLEVDERINAEGQVVRRLDEAAFIASLDAFVEREKVDAIAVCLMHSYINAAHEERLAALVRERHPNLYLSLSGEGYPVIREYGRWTTTALNAYVQPIVHSYLTRIESGLDDMGFVGQLLVMASNGGTLTPAVARRFPSRLLESGPAAGILMSAFVGETLARKDLLTFDIGGTTAKGALILDGRPMKKYELEVAHVHHFRRGSGLTVNLPVIDMIEIGVGGGSLANIDDRKLLQVGPTSAGALPGPACYGRGGTHAALTDANLTLGYLNPDFFLGGRMKVYPEEASKAIDRDVSVPLDLQTTRAAWGIHEKANENVANAFRVHASERGIDVRRCAMVAFGGSGPLHATRIARKLRIGTVILPPAAGVMSAFGMLVSPLSFEVARSRTIALADLGEDVWNVQFDALRRQATSELADASLREGDVELRARVDLRYIGQGFDVSVDVDLGLGATGCVSALPKLFDAAYMKVFGVTVPGQPVEVVTWRLEAVERRRRGVAHRLASYGASDSPLKGTRQAYDPDAANYVAYKVYDRYRLSPGASVEGPALFEELESTTVIGSGMHATVDPSLNLIVQVI
ncbi:hydantoinase/oxoprolinase family protein [Paraburkholderia xenovorans]|uniref:hydantoinase/oxoprolinase family protein n=1 Tax=Paraburkholderia xenovorans TaxID=36873 RepID=UPI0015C522B9|nr:hydantoinase/oxoprolinase family protein [Paraburkholderia xenovorans]NPT38245.1 hydantoinase/oxoprolinase family protein [Paraburkholderia xenovorans]